MKIASTFQKFFVGFLLVAQAGLGFKESYAQTYSLNFENVSKSNYALDTITINGYRWALRESVIGSSASDLKNGAKAARIRNALGDTVHMQMIDDKPDGLGTISFQYARSNFGGDRTGIAPKLAISYSTDFGLSWTNIDTIDFANVDTLASYVSAPINVPGNVRLQFRTAGGSAGKRINIDDIDISGFVIINNISIIDKSPIGLAISPAVDSLTILFDNTIAAGIGEINVYEVGMSQPQTFTIPSAQITIQDSTAIIHGVQLANNATYYVNVSAGAFTNTMGLTPNLAIDDDITWRFTTADTVLPLPLTALHETFSACDDSTALGLFYQYNAVGERRWRCNTSGLLDSSGISMLGGIADGVSEVNMDWLISKSPFDFSAMSTPFLSLWQRRNYDGQVNRDIRISTDFAGTGNPEMATWHTIEVQAMTAAPTYYWTLVTNISLDSIKHTPFYLAFTYSNTTAGAYEVVYDDIRVTNEPVVNIKNSAEDKIGITLLGKATANQIPLKITSNRASEITLGIIDLLGRKLGQKRVKLDKGINIITMSSLALSKTMYIISAHDDLSQTAIKVMID